MQVPFKLVPLDDEIWAAVGQHDRYARAAATYGQTLELGLAAGGRALLVLEDDVILSREFVPRLSALVENIEAALPRRKPYVLSVFVPWGKIVSCTPYTLTF